MKKSHKRKLALVLVSFVLIAGLFASHPRIMAGIWAMSQVESLSVEQAALRMANGELMVIDTRTREEFEVSHLENAVLAEDLDFSQLSKNQEILVYCTVGLRSSELGATLNEKGFQHIYNLKSGIIKWKNDGLPVYNSNQNSTDSVHVYSPIFRYWLNHGHAID